MIIRILIVLVTWPVIWRETKSLKTTAYYAWSHIFQLGWKARPGKDATL